MLVKHFHLRLSKEYLQEDENRANEFMQSVEVVNTSAQLVTVGSTSYWSLLVFYHEKTGMENTGSKGESQQATEPLSAAEQTRYEALKNWRRGVALDASLPDYMIAHNKTLMDIARKNCSTREDLIEIKGFGEIKVNKYGEQILLTLKNVRS